MENTAGNARRCRIHSKNSFRFHPGNRVEVFIWQNFQPAYRSLPRSQLEKPRSREPSQPALKYEHIENFTKDSEVRRDLGNRASPVNRAHMKRPALSHGDFSEFLVETAKIFDNLNFFIIVHYMHDTYILANT